MLGRRVVGVCLLVASAAGLTGCRDGGTKPVSASPSVASAPASTTAPPSTAPSATLAAPAASVRTPAGWPTGLPVPTASLTDAAALKAYVDSLTPEQRQLFGAAVREGMSPDDRAQLDQLNDRLKSLPPGALKACTALIPVAATAAAVGLTAWDDGPEQVKARRGFADSLDRLRADTDPTTRVERDLRVMAGALRRYAGSGRALVASAPFTGALDDLSRYVDETCGDH